MQYIVAVQIQNTSYARLVGIKIDSKLNFKNHDGNIYKKVRAKSNDLTRISGYMNPAEAHSEPF